MDLDEEETNEHTVGRNSTGFYDPASPPQEIPRTSAVPAPARKPLQPTRQNSQWPPQTRVTKTGKVQETVAKQAPKQPDPIRGMVNSKGFDVGQILNLPVQLSLGDLLNRSD